VVENCPSPLTLGWRYRTGCDLLIFKRVKLSLPAYGEDGVCMKDWEGFVQSAQLYFVADGLLRNSAWTLHHIDVGNGN